MSTKADISDHNEATEAGNIITRKLLTRISAFPTPTGLTTYESKPTDVIITAFPKGGHTMFQNIAHEILIHAGRKPDVPIDDITVAIPWIDFMPEMGLKHPNCMPRVYKSHSPRSQYEEAGRLEQKFIVVIRNPVDFPASWLNFVFDILTGNSVTDPETREAVFHAVVKTRLLGHSLPPSPAETGTEAMAMVDSQTKVRDDHMAKRTGRWFAYTLSWVRPVRKNALVMFYEDAVRDLAGTVRTVADFMQCDLTPASVDAVTNRCQKGAMLNDSRFRCGVEGKMFGFGDSAWKVMDGDRGGFKRFQLLEEDKVELARQMREVLGVDSYEELKQAVKQEQWKLFQR